MSANRKALSVPRIKRRESKQFPRYSLLAELPGLIFGLLTVVYVASALWLLG
jgi:hypothetical protein